MERSKMFSLRRDLVVWLGIFLLASSLPVLAGEQDSLAERVEIRRTSYGIPHILADDLASVFFGLAYCHLEDHGERVVLGVVRTRGELARYLGRDELDSDFFHRSSHARAVETFHLLDEDTRNVFRGYAAGVNHYIRLHPEEFPEWVQPSFTPHDVAALWIGRVSRSKIKRFLKLQYDRESLGEESTLADEDGSNAWAFAPSRTVSGNGILMRNPHLDWDAGYYEAHITVPGIINFYGDFRVGRPLYYNGGFNDSLGWATTNNYPDLDEVYALEVDPDHPDHYLFDGGSVPLRREWVTVEFKNGDGLARESREFFHTPLGPVIHRGGGKIFIFRSAPDGEFRMAEQFLRMMRAENLEEWKSAMRIRAQPSSNFTYADREGNIFYLWNAAIPDLPHPPGEDKTAVVASRSDEVWTKLVEFEELPQLLNPTGGYLHNENDSFLYTNLHQMLDPDDFPANFPEPRLRLRSQYALKLIDNDRKLTLEEVVDLKHSMRMLLADRVKDELIVSVRSSDSEPDMRRAIQVIENWDNTVAADSRGAELFRLWFETYLMDEEMWNDLTPERWKQAWKAAFRDPWNPDEPLTTPRGLGNPERAVEAFRKAADETLKKYGGWDVAWGEVHRLQRGSVDVPVGGCPGFLGCFRVLNFEESESGKSVASRGDAWVLAVEFGDPPRAYSVLAYGQSSKEDSPHYADQAELFARNQMKKVAFTEDEIRAQLLRKYRPGSEMTDEHP
jgi:acyl-homoserine-lactone acylase